MPGERLADRLGVSVEPWTGLQPRGHGQRSPIFGEAGLLRLIEALLAWLYPARCPGCLRVEPADAFCPACRSQMRPDRLRLEDLEVAVCGPYEAALRRAVLGFKTSGRTSFVPPMGRLMARSARELLGLAPGVVVVGVPAVAARLRYRGFEPACLLAAEVARELQLQPARGLLVARGTPAPQKSLGAAGRRQNLRGVFTLTGTPAPEVLLVDDVVTTGSTLLTCRDALLDGGAERVTALCFAQALRRV